MCQSMCKIMCQSMCDPMCRSMYIRNEQIRNEQVINEPWVPPQELMRLNRLSFICVFYFVLAATCPASKARIMWAKGELTSKIGKLRWR